MTELTRIEQAADLLVQARRCGALMTGLEDTLAPATLSDAYAVQDATLDRLGPAGGWKVAAKPGEEPRCALLPASGIAVSGSAVPVPQTGYEIEVETAFVFRHALPQIDRAYTESEVLAAIGSLHLALEILGSRFVDRRALPPLQPIADLQSNAGVILGPEVEGWQTLDLAALDMVLTIDGAPQRPPQRHASFADTLPTLVWLAGHAARRGRPIAAGTVVITGARLGPVPLGSGSTVAATCAGLGAVTVTFTR